MVLLCMQAIAEMAMIKAQGDREQAMSEAEWKQLSNLIENDRRERVRLANPSRQPDSRTRSLIHSLTHSSSLTHLRTHLATCLLTHAFTHSLTHSLATTMIPPWNGA